MSETRIMVGHVLDRLRDLPDESVHMVWTSVPYWGLRNYGTEPQVWGGEPDCAHEWGSTGRIRRTGGTASSGLGNYDNGVTAEHIENKMRRGRELDASTGAFCQRCGAWRGEHGLEPDIDLWLSHEVAIFREVRRVLRKDGTLWVNCGDAYAGAAGGGQGASGQRAGRTHTARVPEKRGGSYKPKDRLMMPARLAIALQDDGWWLRDEIVWHKRNPMPSSVQDRTTPAHEMLYLLARSPRYYYDAAAIKEPVSGTAHARGSGLNPKAVSQNGLVDERNKRSVWSITTEPFRGAHFATAPTALVEPCVLAGCPRGGTVLDPFGGSGTTALVANRLGRDAILIELKREYAEIARDRLRAGLARIQSDMPDPSPGEGLPLFEGSEI